MKTKEEILDESTFENIEPGVQTEIFTKAECFKAMESYASEQTDKLNQLVRVQDQLIDVLHEPNYEFLGVTHNQDSYSAGDIISRYINKKREDIKQLKTELGL